MTQYGPANAFLLVGGRDISALHYNLADDVESKLEQTNGLGATMEAHKPIGLGATTLEANGGLYDNTTDLIVTALQAKGETRQLVNFGYEGYGVGAECTMIDGGFAATWKRIMKRDALTKAHALYKITGQPMLGRVVHGLTAETTDPGNTEATSIDQSAAQRLPSVTITSNTAANPSVVTATAHGLITGDVVVISGVSTSSPTINGERTVTVISANTFSVPVNVTTPGTGGSFVKVTSTGATADLHMPALTLGGFTSLSVWVRHSADNITFADYITFTTRTTVGAERVTSTAALQRYVAMRWDWIGSGSANTAIPYVSLYR